MNIFDFLIVKPFAFILRSIYDLVGSYGLAIIIFTIVTKIIILPLSIKSKKSMAKMQKLQPKLKELEAKYKNDKQKYQEEMAKLYQTEDVSPLGGCLPTLITLPIMMGLYWPISEPLKHLMNLTAEQIALITERLGMATETGFVSQIALAQKVYENFDLVKDISPNIIPMDMNFLGINLGATPSFSTFNLLFLIPIISGLSAFLLNKLTMELQYRSTGTRMQNQGAMTLMMPLMSVWIGFSLPAGLGLYWIVSNLVAMVQEVFLSKYMEREIKKEAAIEEQKRAKLAEEKQLKKQKLQEKYAAEEAKKANGKNNRSNGKKH